MKLWRGGRKSTIVRETNVDVKLVARKDEIKILFGTGGLERGTTYEVHIPCADYWQILTAMTDSKRGKGRGK